MAKQGAPVQLTLYDADDEPIKELSRLVVPWGILKRAVRLVKNLDVDNVSEEDLDVITALVVEVFGDKVTMEELEKHADIGDMLSVLTMIVAKAGLAMPAANPQTLPAK